MKNYPGEYKQFWEVAPNKQNGDRVVIEPNKAATVSPFHPNFQSQIEPNIWSLIRTLNDKGYFTLSSCQGHRDVLDFFDSKDTNCPFIILAIPSKQAKDYFVRTLTGIKGLHFEDEKQLRDRLFNMEYDPISGQYVRVESRDLDSSQEAETLNKWFMRKADKYYYVCLWMYGSPLDRLFSHRFIINKVLTKVQKLKTMDSV